MRNHPVTIPRMGKKKSDYHRHGVIGFRLEKSLVESLRESAKKNRRTLTAEVSIALEQYLGKSKSEDDDTHRRP